MLFLVPMEKFRSGGARSKKNNFPSDVGTRTIYYDNLKVFEGENGFGFVKP